MCMGIGEGRGEERKLARKASLLTPKRPPVEHLALSLPGSETRFFRAWRVKLILECVSLLMLPKLMQSIRQLEHGSIRKLVPTVPGGMVEAK